MDWVRFFLKENLILLNIKPCFKAKIMNYICSQVDISVHFDKNEKIYKHISYTIG